MKNLLTQITGFLSNTGLTWFGYLGGSVAIFLLLPHSHLWGAISGGLLGAFLMKNIVKIKDWASTKVEDIKESL